MEPIYETILIELASFRGQISSAFLHRHIGQKIAVTFPEFESRLLNLRSQGYVHLEKAGKHVVLVLLTQAGREYVTMSQSLRQPRGTTRRGAALYALLVIGALAIFFAVPRLLENGRAFAPRTAVAGIGQTTSVLQVPLTAPTLPAPPSTETPLPTATSIPTETATLTPLPTATFVPTPTLTAIPTVLTHMLVQTSGVDRLSGYHVGVSVLMPLLNPALSTEDIGFNQVILNYADSQQQEVIDWLKEPVPDPGGFMNVDYIFVSAANWAPGEDFLYFSESSPTIPLEYVSLSTGHSVVSVLFANTAYYGGAHPNTHFQSVNYDFTTSRPLYLENLFRPGSSYLDVISNYCVGELSQYPEFEGFEHGAMPLPENYQVWAITRFGLLIVFQEYQVGPYSSGAHSVIVPYSVLEKMIEPAGPLWQFAR